MSINNNNAILVTDTNHVYEVTLYNVDEERRIMQCDITGIRAVWTWQQITLGTPYKLHYRRVQ